jgi:hypothetical protein
MTDSKIAFTVTLYICKHCGIEVEYGDLRRKRHWV